MRAVLDDAAAVQDGNAVGGGGLGEAVGDDEGGAIGGGGAGRAFQHPGTGTARLGSGLVEHHDGLRGQRDPGQRKLGAATLPAVVLVVVVVLDPLLGLALAASLVVAVPVHSWSQRRYAEPVSQQRQLHGEVSGSLDGR